MRPEDLDAEMKKRPFRPLRLHISGGMFYEVRHPEQAVVGESVVVVGTHSSGQMDAEDHDMYEVVSLLHVIRVVRLQVSRPSTRNGA